MTARNLSLRALVAVFAVLAALALAATLPNAAFGADSTPEISAAAGADAGPTGNAADGPRKCGLMRPGMRQTARGASAARRPRKVRHATRPWPCGRRPGKVGGCAG